MSRPSGGWFVRSLFLLGMLAGSVLLQAAPPPKAPVGYSQADLGGPLGPDSPQKPNSPSPPEAGEDAGPVKPVLLPANSYEWLTYILTTPNWSGGGQRLLQKWDGLETENPFGPAPHLVNRGRTVLILGDTSGLEMPGLENFVRSGGNLIVASDSTLGEGRLGLENAMVHLTGTTISGNRVRASPPETGFQQSPDLLPVTGNKDFPWFKNRAGVAGDLISNAPSTFPDRSFNGEVVGWYKGRVRTGARGPAQEKVPFALVSKLRGQEGHGRVVLLGDPNVFSNQMLTLPGNLAFACNFAEWIANDGLAEGQARRDQLLLIVDGQVVDKPFVPPLPIPDMPFPEFPKEDLLSLLYRLAEGAVQAGEVLVSKVEDENIPDRAGAAILRFMWPVGILIVASIGVAVWLFVVMTRKTLNQDMAEVKKPV